jgi:hypothetical protein
MSVGPLIVFDEEPDTDLAPILLRFRQPSFTKLDGSPIPKGFDSLSDFREKQVLVAFHPRLDFSLRSSSSTQDLLLHRNADKWRELGYDPNLIRPKPRRETLPTPDVGYPIHVQPSEPASDV